MTVFHLIITNEALFSKS